MEQRSLQNRLLRRLPAASFDRVAPALRYARLPVAVELVTPGTETATIWFIEDGLASVVTSNSDGESIEVNVVGFEGITGVHRLFGVETAQNRTFMQVAGSAYGIAADTLTGAANEDSELQKILLQYAYAATQQLAHTALANGRYTMPARLSRWLLMCHDRVGSTDLSLTHDFLGAMLGVRRSGVTEQIHILEGLHAIKATRGNIKILDRPQLLTIAGACYGEPERLYDSLFGI